MENQYTNVRFESKSKHKMINEIKHELRTTKIASVVNNNSNVLIFKNEKNEWITKEYQSKDKDVKEISTKYINELDNIENKHRKLLRKNFNQSLNKKRTNSANTGVLTFSSSIEKLVEEDKNKIIELGFKTITNICKELDIELHYITFHLDEKGLPHFHYLTDNFNSQGKTISPKRNQKVGKKLQDLGNLYFKELGFSEKEADIYINRGNTLVQLKRYNEAVYDYEFALKIDTDNYLTHFNLARAHYLTDSLGLAKHSFETCVKLYNTFAPAYYFLGMIALEKNELEASCLLLQKAGDLGYRQAVEVQKLYCN